MFRKAMKYVGIMQDDPRFVYVHNSCLVMMIANVAISFLKKLSFTAVFGQYLFNLACVNSADFVKNIVRSGNYQNPVYRWDTKPRSDKGQTYQTT